MVIAAQLSTYLLSESSGYVEISVGLGIAFCALVASILISKYQSKILFIIIIALASIIVTWYYWPNTNEIITYILAVIGATGGGMFVGSFVFRSPSKTDKEIMERLGISGNKNKGSGKRGKRK